MQYYSETDKIREILDPKYLEGVILDIGSGEHKIKPDAIGIDGRDLPEVDIVLKKEEDIYFLEFNKEIPHFVDAIFSSHCLEHLADDYTAIRSWSSLIKKDGYLILYLPDGNYYSHEGNMEHMRPYTYDSFMFWFRRVFCGEGKNYNGDNFRPWFQLIESGQDIRPDCYSFYVIAKKL